ncbi:ABC transporter permease subunit [Modestobacter sp. I12A-02628]|uniref:ABC transporter permease n=1 Tax=Goekera deserti TaxID=2497753 RepID=A0A7K3WCM5_9ACTN|nr:ABC transporter permease [Goekera deserti]MPQ98547.1 ABC transporter permease subunit [Goekera deserti]NDI49082.1 ABC transporter permease subunit [Goekera deserti]NEL54127.1 ABC transporter permease [Goekera deserti]
MATTQATTEAPVPAEPGLPPGGGVEREFTVKARSQRQQVLRRFRRNKVGMTGLVIFLAMLAFGFLGPLFYDVDYATLDRNAQSVPPGEQGYPLGSDEIGRDLLAGLMSGVQRSMLIVLLFVAIALPLGLLVGALAGYFGKWVDSLLMRLVDLILTVPLLVVLIVVASNFPEARTPLGVGILLGLFGWLDLARIVRSQFLSLREKEYVEAAHALGASNSRIIFRHLIPNALGSLIVWTTLAAATAIILEASLTYLGVGVNGAGETSLGRLVSDGVQATTTRPWLFYFPGITLLIIVLSINLIGDGIRDAFDPSNRRVRA